MCIRDRGEALLAAKIILYAQGCAILIDCTKEYGWKMHIPTIARLWRGGCIIRSNMLEDIVEAFETNPDPVSYTHLDVYKRQLSYHYVCPGHASPAAEPVAA